jgi:hypothetical protein
MNRRLSKKINQKTIDIFLEWLSSVISEEQASQIVRKNYKEYVPENAYYWSKHTILNSVFSPRWVKRKLKRKLRQNPQKKLDSYCMNDLK